jgi:hypothetical protein
MLPFREVTFDQLPTPRFELNIKDPALPRFTVWKKGMNAEIHYLVKPGVMEADLWA